MGFIDYSPVCIFSVGHTERLPIPWKTDGVLIFVDDGVAGGSPRFDLGQ
jgi:hypothetical protein